MELTDFLIKAKISGYATGGEGKEIRLKDGGLKFCFKEAQFEYTDIYYGFNPFYGREFVSENDSNIWVMNYYGKSYLSRDETLVTYQFLKKALQLPDNALPLRGPEYFEDSQFVYLNKAEGDLKIFHGKEEIFNKDKKLIYELYYHGGNIVI